MVAMEESPSDIASSDDGDYGEDENDEETKQDQLSNDDEPGWAMGTITNTVQQHMERFRQEQMKLDKLTLRDGRTQPTTSLKEIRSTAHQN